MNRKTVSATVPTVTSSIRRACRSTQRSAAVVAAQQPSKNALGEAVEPPVLLVARSAAGGGAHIIGVSVSDTTADSAMATLSVTANSRNRRPTMPPISRIGMNTASSETVIETMVKPICRAPSSAASQRRLARPR